MENGSLNGYMMIWGYIFWILILFCGTFAIGYGMGCKEKEIMAKRQLKKKKVK